MELGENQKSLIIIGAGLNGLSAGIAYALNTELHHNDGVLILDKNPVPGGYVTSFERKGFVFDTCQMASAVGDILDYFGIEMDWRIFRDDFMRVIRADTTTGTTRTWEFFADTTKFHTQMIALFPGQATALEKFFNHAEAMFAELFDLKYEFNPVAMLSMLLRCPKVIRCASKTFDEYYARFGFTDKQPYEVFQVFSALCGLPNKDIAALLPVGVMLSLLENACRPVGPFIDLPRKMEERFRALGGEVRLNSKVEQILIRGDKAIGVRLKTGRCFYAQNIIAAMDIKETMDGLVGKNTVRHLDARYANRISEVTMTPSAFTVSLGIDGAAPALDRLNVGYAVLTSGPDAFDNAYRAFRNNEMLLNHKEFYINIACTKTQDKRYTLVLQALPMPADFWIALRRENRAEYTRRKEEVAQVIVDIAQQYLVPHLREHIVVTDVATPATYRRYSGSPTGSVYDMACVPQNFGKNRIPLKTPIKGLYVPKFAHGVFGAMNSGLQAADLLTGGKVMNGNSRFGKRSR